MSAHELFHLSKRARRGVTKVAARFGVESHKGLQNALYETVDVGAAYDELARQRAEAAKYVRKWETSRADTTFPPHDSDSNSNNVKERLHEANRVSISSASATAAAFRSYATALASIAARERQTLALEATVAKLETRLRRGTAREVEVNGARAQRDDERRRTNEHGADTHRRALIALADAHVAASECEAQAYRALRAAIEYAGVAENANAAVPDEGNSQHDDGAIEKSNRSEALTSSNDECEERQSANNIASDNRPHAAGVGNATGAAVVPDVDSDEHDDDDPDIDNVVQEEGVIPAATPEPTIELWIGDVVRDAVRDESDQGETDGSSDATNELRVPCVNNSNRHSQNDVGDASESSPVKSTTNPPLPWLQTWDVLND